jgi:hypothetical protein
MTSGLGWISPGQWGQTAWLNKGQIHVGDAAVIKHLADYSTPRLVEYFDNNPCRLLYPESRAMDMIAKFAAPARAERERTLGVTVEAQYTVGEYDIIILSANESAGLETWLIENGYRIPKGASSVLHSYIKQHLKFFVAKVNLGEQAKLGLMHFRPLQIAFESPRFMLPIRLGTVNADGPQELFLYVLTKQGRVRDDELSDRPLTGGAGGSAVRQRPFRRLLPGHVRPASDTGAAPRGLSGIRLGHDLVRPLRGRPPVACRASKPRRLLADREWAHGKGAGACAERLSHASSRAL